MIPCCYYDSILTYKHFARHFVVYFFIMPFVLAFVFVALKGAVSARYKITQWSRARVPRFLRKRPFGAGLSVMDLVLIVATLTYSALLLWARMKRSLTRGAKKLTYFYQVRTFRIVPSLAASCHLMDANLLHYSSSHRTARRSWTPFRGKGPR